MRTLALASVVASALLASRGALAQEAQAPPPPPPSAHELRMRELHEKRDEAEMEASVERAMRERDMQRAGVERSGTPRVFEKGRVLLPNIAGLRQGGLVVSVPGFYGSFFATGPLTFSYGSSSGYESTFFGLTPEIDVLVTDHLTLGGGAGFLRATSRSEPGPSVGTSRVRSVGTYAQPRVGWVQPIGRGVSVWPRLALRVGGTWSEANEGSQKVLDLGAEVDAPIVFPLSRHVYLQASPIVTFTHRASRGGADLEGNAFSFGSYLRLGLAL